MELASTGMTPDGEFVSGFPSGKADPSFLLLDRTGTVLWQFDTDLATSCLMEARFNGIDSGPDGRPISGPANDHRRRRVRRRPRVPLNAHVGTGWWLVVRG